MRKGPPGMGPQEGEEEKGRGAEGKIVATRCQIYG